MKYMGSKSRIAKHILPIMLKSAYDNSITTWVEPFVGGGNMIDKVPSYLKRIGYDVNPHTVQAMIGIRDFLHDLPDEVSEDYYRSLKGQPADPVTSWIRYECSFGSKFEGGYARNSKGSNYALMGLNLAKKQNASVQNVEFYCGSYLNISFTENSIIYCDPPYQGTTGYKTGDFNHPEFWQWCRDMSNAGHVVFVSEYNAPEDFIEVWRGQVKTNFASNRNQATHSAVERLFIYAPQQWQTELNW